MNNKINAIKFSPTRHCQVVISGEEDKEKYNEAHRHDFFELIWCLDSVGAQIIDFKPYDNRRGRIFSLTPGQVHQAAEDNSLTRMLIFPTDFIDNRYRKQALLERFFSSSSTRTPYIDTLPAAYPYLDSIFRLMHEESCRPMPNWDLVESLTISFLFYIIRYALVDNSLTPHYETRIVALKTLIDMYYKQEKNCGFYSNQLSITNKRLNEITKQALGKTVSKLIQERLILEAKRELLFTEKSVKEIAFSLGYSDPSYFSRFYANHTGLSPSDFRRECLNST